MKITCNEARNGVVCVFICAGGFIVPGIGIAKYFKSGAEEGGAAMIGMACFLAILSLIGFLLASKRSYRVSEETLEHLWWGRVLKKWDLESADIRISKSLIIIDGERLCWIRPGGRALRIISRRLTRYAQPPRPPLSWRENLRDIIVGILLVSLACALLLALFFGLIFPIVLLERACDPERSWDVHLMILIDLLISLAIFIAVGYATRKPRKAFNKAVSAFVGRMLGVSDRASR